MTLLSSYAHRCLHLVMLACIVLLLVACSAGGSASSPGPGGTPSLGVGNQQTPTLTGAPGVPDGVILTNLGLGQVKVAWFPTLPYDSKIDHYDVYEIHADNSIGGKVASVPATAQQLETIAKNLNLCTYYRFGVVAVSTDGKQSAMTLPDKQAFTWGSAAPGTIPNTVVIMAMGVSSHVHAGSFSPLDGQSYCTTADGNSPVTDAPSPLQDLLDIWDNQDPANRISHPIDTHGPNGFGAGNRLIDSLASTGAIVLPMSYSKGTRLTGPPAAPTFTTAGYNPDDVGNTSPDQVAQWLDDELVSIHTTWPNAHIIVVGHSAGGLATYLWWTQHGQYQPQGVVQAFSLDGPINGTQNSLCSHHLFSWGCSKVFGIDSPLAQKVADLWNQQDHFDFDAQKIEQKSPIFTAVGTQGDAVWDFADGNRCVQIGTQCVDYPGGDNNGLVSQVFHGDTCKSADYTASSSKCATGAHSIESRCGPLVDGTHDLYGLTGTLWTHSDVKNCRYVIPKIVAYAYHPTSKATANENPLGKVDWTKVVTETDLGCNGPTGPHLGVQVDEKQFADVTGDGKKEAFVAVACVASTSSWPDRLEVFDGASDPAHPRLIATLLDYKDGTDERGLRIGGNVGIPQSITISGRTVTVVSDGYAATDSNASLSLQITDTFTWNGSGFTRAPRSVVQAKAP